MLGREIRHAVVVTLLACSCGTTVETVRFRVSAKTEPADATVAVRQGPRVVAAAPAPLIIDEDHDVTRSPRSSYRSTLIAGVVVSLLGLLMSLDAPDPNKPFDISDGMGQAIGPYVMAPGLMLVGIGAIGMSATPDDPPFTVTAIRPGYEFDDLPFEPGSEPTRLFLKGRPVETPVENEGSWPVVRYGDE